MKKLRPAAVLVPILLTALIGCGSSKTTSDGAADVTTDTAAEVSTVGGSTAVTEPVASPGATKNPAGTAPSATNPPPTSPPGTTPAGQKPKINDFSVGAAPICFPEAPDYVYPTTITASWDVSGATSIYLAIGDESGAFEQNLSPTGSIEVPTQYPCLADPADVVPMTYYLIAENAAGRTVEQETR